MEKVMIVDDDELSRERLAHIFSREDYSVEQADSGKSALELMAKDPPDIILLDVDMPGQDGFEVCRKIKLTQELEMIPVIFITGFADIEDKVRGFDAGGNDYITKPINPKEVKIRVNAHLRIKQAEIERCQAKELAAVKDMIVTYNHEMSQPLTAIQGYADLLMSDVDKDDENYEAFKTIKEQTRRVAGILNKIKLLDKVERQEYIAGSTMIDLKL